MSGRRRYSKEETYVATRTRKGGAVPEKPDDIYSEQKLNSSKCDNNWFPKWPDKEGKPMICRSNSEANQISKRSEAENNDVRISKDNSENSHSPKCSVMEDIDKHSKNSVQGNHSVKLLAMGAPHKDSSKSSNWGHQSPKWSDVEVTFKEHSKSLNLGNHSPNWSDIIAADKERQAAYQDGTVKRETKVWGTDLDQTGPDASRQDSPNILPKSRWNMSYRSQSRSPSCGLRHESDRWNKRGRMGTGACSPPYQEFTAGRYSRRTLDNKSSKWSELKNNDVGMYKDNSESSHSLKWSDREMLPGRWSELHSGNHNRETTGWGTALGQAGVDARRQRSRSISPKDGSNKSHRNRSRSPPYSSKHRSESWDNRGRKGMGGSAPPSRDFAAERCRRWNPCTDLHENGTRRHSENGSEDLRERKKGRYSGRDSRDSFTDSWEQRDYSRDGLSERQGIGEEKHELLRNHRSSASCYDFLKGRCRRGSSCKFVHHDDSSNGGRFTEDDSRGTSYDRRDSDASFGKRTEPQRTSTNLCKYFANGHCHHGENCSSSHQGIPHSHVEGMQHDKRWRYNQESDNNKSWNGPKWGDQIPNVDAPNSSWNGPKWDDQPTIVDTHMLSSNNREWDDRKTSTDAHIASWPRWGDHEQKASVDAPKSWDGPKWADEVTCEATTVDEPASSQWTNNGASRATAAESLGIEDSQPEHLYLPSQSLKDIRSENLPEEASQTAVHPKEQDIPLEASGKLQPVLEEAFNNNTYVQQHPCIGTEMVGCESGIRVANSETGQNTSAVNVPTLAFATENFFCKKHPQDHNGQSQQIFNLNSPPHDDHSVSPSVLYGNMAPQRSDPQSLNSDEHSDQVISQQGTCSQHMQSGGGETMPNAKLSELRSFQLSSDTSITEKLISSERLTKVAENSASLAHILGNGQQVPQPCGTPNSLDSDDLASSQPLYKPSATASAPSVHHNQGSSSTKPVTLDSSDLPPGFSSVYVEEKDLMLVEESQITLKRSDPFPVTDGPNKGHLNECTGLEEKLHQGIQQSKEVELGGHTGHVNETENEQSKRELHFAHSRLINDDVRTNEENKTAKDEKVIRMFKFAIADFAKDILKPSWKEGHLSKEAHKTIVKKVVDKVISIVEGPNLPRNQEQIELYMSFSKIKLTNLVHAYLGKFVKS